MKKIVKFLLQKKVATLEARNITAKNAKKKKKIIYNNNNSYKNNGMYRDTGLYLKYKI